MEIRVSLANWAPTGALVCQVPIHPPNWLHTCQGPSTTKAHSGSKGEHMLSHGCLEVVVRAEERHGVHSSSEKYRVIGKH